MSFHVKDDFAAGEPISSVGASWFNSVAAFLNNLCGVGSVVVEKPTTPSSSAPVTIEIQEPKAAGTATTAGSFPSNEVTQAENVLWRAGGTNGATLYVVFKGESNTSLGTHKLFAAQLTISPDGRIVRIAAATNKGIEIGA